MHFIHLFSFVELLLNYCLLTLELFRAHRVANRNLNITLGIFISKWMIASRVTELSISLQKYAAIGTNENNTDCNKINY